jgi:hypothetical protein
LYYFVKIGKKLKKMLPFFCFFFVLNFRIFNFFKTPPPPPPPPDHIQTHTLGTTVS